ncbi:MAG TPA: DUF2155 domain-containing protein [Xanthobacteraceae bacterium]|nr:DUF2155 domain-containing protein [Xanthobacteraceae bacterium]
MVRFSAGLLGVIAAAWLAPSAVAQFGQTFELPPRPPASIPNRPDLPPPAPPQVVPPDVPPDQPRPSDEIQSQPLPPPPLANPAPPTSRPQAPTAQAPQPGVTPNPAALPNPGAAPNPAAAPPPVEEAIPEPPTPKIANPTAVFAGLDKITGRIISFDVAIDETVRFGALEVTPRVCYTRPPTELPQTDGFVEVDELTLKGELRRIFTGWMFAASPGLNAVEHPIYDVWLTDCKGGNPPAVAADAPPVEPAPPPRAPVRPRPPARTQAQPPAAPAPR